MKADRGGRTHGAPWPFSQDLNRLDKHCGVPHVVLRKFRPHANLGPLLRRSQ